MIGPVSLALRSITHHRVRTLLLVLCIALVAALPLAIQLLMLRHESTITTRATDTPLVVGAPGSRFDLLLHSLYFRTTPARTLSLADAERIGEERIEERPLATAIPLFLDDTARGHPLVGTTLDYFPFRGLQVSRGTLPQLLGDAVVGEEVAESLGVGVGDPLLTDSGRLYDIGSTYPLRLRIVGVLARSGGPDDRAVFTSLRTTWVVRGLGHGHEALDADSDPALLLGTGEGAVTASAAVRTWTEITDENRSSFHFHGEADAWPVSAIIVVPRDPRSGTILRARLSVDPLLESIEPREVLDETLSIVLRVKRFFDANTLLVGTATALLLILVFALDWKVRQRERETLLKIGASRGWILRVATIELLLILGAGALVAVGSVTLGVLALDRTFGI
ncbi:MAG: ABC transporter permease [Planctomycetota bacterium]